MRTYNNADEWINACNAYFDSLDQTKLGLFRAYSALTDTFRDEYERAFFKRGYSPYIDYWLNLYRICKDERDQLSAELFDIEYID